MPEKLVQGLRNHVQTLSSRDFEGRLTGSNGEKKATEYVAKFFKVNGLLPNGDNASYFETFSFSASVSLGGKNKFSFSKGGVTISSAVKADFLPLAFSKTGTRSAKVYMGTIPDYASHGSQDVKFSRRHTRKPRGKSRDLGRRHHEPTGRKEDEQYL